MITKIRNKKWLKTSCIIGSFAILALLEVIGVLLTNKYQFTNDDLFHIKRVLALIRAIQHGDLLPHFNFWTMNQNGSAIMTFYPYLTLLPFVMILQWMPFTVTSLYLITALIFFIGLVVGYYASAGIIKDEKRKYLFAILYETTEMFAMNAFLRMDLGALLTNALLPLIFFGTLNLIKHSKWAELSIGLILLAYSHILGLLICTIFVIIIMIINADKLFDKKHIISIIKLAIVTLLTSAYQIVPILNIMMKNKIQVPIIHSSMSGEPIVMLIIIMSSTGIIGILSGILNFKHLDRIDKELLIIDILLVVFVSNLVPWKELAHTPIKIIQVPFRLLIVSVIISAYILSKCINKYNKKYQDLKLILVIGLAIVLQFDNQFLLLDQLSSHGAIQVTRKITLGNGNGIKHIEGTNRKHPVTGKSNEALFIYAKNGIGLRKMTHAYWADTFNPDYLTFGNEYKYNTKMRNIMYAIAQGKIGISNGQKINYKELGNGTFKFNNHKAIRSINTPIDEYNGIKYSVKLDNKPIKHSKGKNNFIMIHNIKPGTHKLSIMTKPNSSEYIGAIASIMGILLLIGIKYRKHES